MIWKPDANSNPEDCAPGVVTSGGGVISICIIPRDGKIMVPKDGVRHLSDPQLHRFVHLRLGCWVTREEFS